MCSVQIPDNNSINSIITDDILLHSPQYTMLWVSDRPASYENILKVIEKTHNTH